MFILEENIKIKLDEIIREFFLQAKRDHTIMDESLMANLLLRRMESNIELIKLKGE